MLATLRRRGLRSGEAWLRSDVAHYAAVYLKDGKGLRNDVGFYAATY